MIKKYPSCMIDREGKPYFTDSTNHEDFCRQHYIDNYCKSNDGHDNSHYLEHAYCAYDTLREVEGYHDFKDFYHHELGWVSIGYGIGRMIVSIERKPTKRQVNYLYKYAEEYGCKEILSGISQIFEPDYYLSEEQLYEYGIKFKVSSTPSNISND